MKARITLSLGLCFCTLMAAACLADEEPAPSSVRKRGVQLAPAPPAKPAARPDDRPIAPYLPNEAERAPENTEPRAETVSAEEAAPDQPEKPPRDFSRELESMFGSPAGCLAPRPANEAPAQLRISLSASVMPSGAVGRSEVSAPGLSASEIDCVKKRLGSLRFAPPIENAPFTVSGSITLNRGS